MDFFLQSNKFLHVFYALGLFIIGFFIARQVKMAFERFLASRFSRHQTQVISRALFYLIFGLFFIAGLQQLGVHLSILLGAAGILTVAIGFASQTAASNLISGIFLLFERPFVVGDNIEVKGMTGIVDAIDLLSTKIRTPDNKLIRIPNETMLKSELTNLSSFSTRRIDLIVNVAYSNDITRVKLSLIRIANQDELILNDPAPSVLINNLTDSAVEIKLLAWVDTSNLTLARASLQEKIKQEFEAEKIEFALSQWPSWQNNTVFTMD